MQFIKEKYILDLDSEKDLCVKKFKQFIKSCIDGANDDKFSSEYWKDVEMAFGDITSNSELFTNGDEWQKCYDSFCISLAEYLKDESKKIVCNKYSQYFFEDIQNFYSKLFIDKSMTNQGISLIDIKNCEFNFIDFNYTRILDEFLEEKDKFLKENNTIGELIHIHGDLKNGIILGVDNDTQIASSGLINKLGSYSKIQFIKPESMEMKARGTRDRAYNIMINSDVIIIFGCSLGDTDKTWRDYLIECIHKNKRVIFTKKDDLVVDNNINIYDRELYNSIESNINDFASRIDIKNYFVQHGYKDQFTNPYESVSYHIKNYIKYGHRNLFENLKDIAI